MRNILELLHDAAESYLLDVSDPVEKRTLQNYIDKLKRAVEPRMRPRTSALVIKMADHPVAKRRAPVASKGNRFAAISGYRQHGVNEFGDAVYAED